MTLSGRRLAVALLLLVGLYLRVAGNTWGLVHYTSLTGPPAGVHGTVYTYMPDEKEFLGCYRALGLSAERSLGGMPLQINAHVGALVVRKFLTGDLTFAPVYPTTSSPLMSYVVFFVSLPLIALKYLLGGYEVLSSNVVFREALLVGRYLTALFDLLSLLVVKKILEEFGVGRVARRLGLLLLLFLPANLIVSRLLSYNTLALCLELGAFVYVLRFARSGETRPAGIAALLCGAGLATKFTALTVLGVLLVAWIGRIRRMGLRRGLLGLARLLGLVVLSYAALAAYGFFSHGSEFLVNAREAYFNLASSSRVTYAAPKSLIITNFFLNVLPTGYSWCVFVVGLVALGTMAARFAAGPSWPLFLLLFYFGGWFFGTMISPLNMLMRLLVLYSLGVIILALWIDSLRSRGLVVFLAVLMLANQLLDASLLVRFFRSEDVRVSASNWIRDHVPAGSTIGLLNEFPYWYSPEILYTDFFWNEPRRYTYFPSVHEGITWQPDHIVIARAEIFRTRGGGLSVESQFEELRQRGYRLRQTFAPHLSWGGYRLRYESDRFAHNNIFVSDIYIFERVSPGNAS